MLKHGLIHNPFSHNCWFPQSRSEVQIGETDFGGVGVVVVSVGLQMLIGNRIEIIRS